MTAATWEFEAADPEVGILTDDVTHTCKANLDNEPQSAVVADRTLVNQPDGKTVVETFTLQCPACDATTTATEQWPVWMFEQ